MLGSLSILALLLAATAPVLGADSPKATVADLAWMTGHWSGPMANGATLEENWLVPQGGSIAALVRSTTADSTSLIELILIEEKEGTLTLRLQQWNAGLEPRSPSPQVMKLVELGENKAAFAPVGEGPLKLLTYTRPAPDQFVIAIQTAQGQEFKIPLTAKK
jgi:hypothetical protein